jgi:hypothetical protein
MKDKLYEDISKDTKYQDLNREFAQYIGTSKYIRHWKSQFIYTEGAKAVFDQYQAFWLTDSIVFLQKMLNKHAFQVWELFSWAGEAYLFGTDGNYNVISKTKIPTTTFPNGKIKLYLENKVIYLPSER